MYINTAARCLGHLSTYATVPRHVPTLTNLHTTFAAKTWTPEETGKRKPKIKGPHNETLLIVS